MTPATLRVVMLVSCAHALVHIYELSLPSVEQLIALDFQSGTEMTGTLGSTWRLPFGLGALAAGWLVDRFGSKRLLMIYLVGCSATSLVAWWSPDLALLFVAMFSMGTFASIYHPAGLALISHEAPPDKRPLALGYHGIFGSIGIAAAPFLAAVALWTGTTWRQYYLLLTVPGLVLAAVLGLWLHERHREPNLSSTDAMAPPVVVPPARWGAFFMLTVVGAVTGFIYAALLNFLPRYLDASDIRPYGVPAESFRNLLAAAVLLVGCIGQYVAGRIARPGRLEPMLVLILLAMAPFLFWMAVAEGQARVWAAGLFALVHFMHQPVYNSMIAHYVPIARRSFGYGISNVMTFGVGSFGAGFAGYAPTTLATYGTLGVLALLAGSLAMILLWGDHRNV